MAATTSPASNFPSFTFSIQNIKYDDEQARHTDGYAWPPDTASAFARQGPKACYIYVDGTWTHVGDDMSLGSNCIAIATVFWHSQYRKFIAMRADATAENETVEGWRPVMFRSVVPGSFQSHVDFTGDHYNLLSPASQTWAQQLLPRAYDYDPFSIEAENIREANNGADPDPQGLSGNLAILLSIIAFSAPQDQLTHVLQTSFTNDVWVRHEHEDDRRDHRRGKVIYVYFNEWLPPAKAQQSWQLRFFAEGQVGYLQADHSVVKYSRPVLR